MNAPRATIAIFNASDDTVDVLAEQLQHLSHVVRAYLREFRQGKHDIGAFIREHDPRVVIWDVSVPYYRNWAFLQKVRSTPTLEGRHLIVTTPNAAVLRDIVGGETGAIEIGDRSEDLERLLVVVSASLEHG